MRKSNQITALLLTIIIALGSIFITPPQKVAAKEVEVNFSTLSDKEIDGLIAITKNEMMSLAVSEYILNNMYNGQTVDFNFSNEAKRRYILKYYGVYYGTKCKLGSSAQLVSKRLFGKSTSNIKIEIGDIGETIPYIGYGERPYLYKRVGSNKYTLAFSVYMIDESDGAYQGWNIIGDVEYTLKRKPGSKFGWVIKSLGIGSSY